MITTLILFASVLTALFFINMSFSLLIFITFALLYIFLALATRKRLFNNSKLISKEQVYVIKSLQEGLGAIRDILIDGAQEIYCNIYQSAAIKLQKASAENIFINQAPRFLMESVGMFLIGILVVGITLWKGSAIEIIPVLGVLALGSQRLLPLMQQIYGNWSFIKSNHVVILDTLDLLNQPLKDHQNKSSKSAMKFEKSIRLKKVSFKYPAAKSLIINQINLKITKGTRIGFVGKTGCGKSTFLDLFMGLLEPSSGEIFVDNKLITHRNRYAFRKLIAHVPQAIFFSDATISENIAFGIHSSKIDHDLVKDVAVKAGIADFIDGCRDGYSTIIGERGVRLSGGQRQRIGIARALYKKASILIFDEATSALDSKTELEVIESIENLGDHLTVIIVAHSLSTLRK